jgi:hypothetical protein
MKNVVLGLGLLLSLGLPAAADTGLARHKKMYVVPTPGKVTIDGKLDDWDLSGQILTYVISENQDMQSAKFAMMYDKQNLYLSAEVRDTTPMLNRHDPKADGDKGWNADACQFRISLDPKQPYPLNIGYGEGDANNMDVTHLTLWYYTDKQEPVLQIAKSMNYKLPRPEWKPTGVVPSDLFQAKYVKMADGRGYIFEYAIPWSTLGVKVPLKSGDIVAGTVQFNYSDPTGLKTAGWAAWCYDVMAGPGFPYQSTTPWGKLIFSDKGKLPRSLVEEGVPPTRELPLKFRYNLPEDSQITIQLKDKNNVVRRILVAQGNRSAGANVEQWDGLDSEGKPLPAGEYKWEGIYHQPLSQKFLFTPMNSGQPPYATDDGTGAWGGDHGTPQSVAAFDDGILMSWSSAEAGSGIIRTDLNGKKQWGNLHCPLYLATDGKHIFGAGDTNFDNTVGVTMLNIADGRPLTFGNGQSNLAPPPGGTAATDVVTGLAYGNGTVYDSFKDRNLIAAYDAQSGALKSTWPIDQPGQLAATANSILAVSAGKLVSIVDGNAKPFASAHLDDPRGITVGPDGTVYVANGGKLQNISVFDGSGKYLRSIGMEGGRPAVGHYDPNGVLDPGGIALDKNGHLWVAERLDFPKRISEWDAATGKFVNEFFGAADYFGYGYIDPKHPDEIYCHNVLWKIDWKNNTCAPVSTIWRQTTPNTMFPPGVRGYLDHPVFMTANNGKQYEYGADYAFNSVVSRRDGDLYKPIAGTIRILRDNQFFTGVPFAFMTPDQFPNGTYFWQDSNDDQLVQPNELIRAPDAGTAGLDGDLNLYLGDQKLTPVRVEDNGRPVYDLSKVVKETFPNEPDGSYYGLAARYAADGKVLWQFPGILEWHAALSKPIQAPGRLWGLTNYLGLAGQFTGWSDYFGTYHVFTRDGVYVGMLMRDLRDGKGLGPDTTASEVLTGQLVKPDGMNRYFLVAGASDARVTEIFGLDSVKPLPGGALTLTDADVKSASDALDDYRSKVARSTSLSIARGRDGLKAAAPVSNAIDANRSFKVRAAYDADNLYLQYDVVSPTELVNAQPDPHILFKGGNILDIQIAADPTADPKRKTPAPGDVRILVTQQNGKPLAVIYRPKVKGFTGTPIVLSSPTGKEPFDSIETTDRIGLDYKKTPDGYTATVTIPQELIGLALKPGMQLKMDVGVIYGNETGNKTLARSYWMNNSFSANVTNDVPNESRLEPAEWGTAGVE